MMMKPEFLTARAMLGNGQNLSSEMSLDNAGFFRKRRKRSGILQM
jgi:hypothetical protein